MEVFSGLVVLAIIIGIIVYCVNKKKQNELKMEEERKKQIEDQKRIEKQREEEMENIKIQWEEKKKEFVTNGLPIIVAETLNLMKSEVCHFVGDACICKIKEEVVGYEGGSRGVSFRITKGFSVKYGNFKGHNIKSTITKRTNGVIYLTNKKIIFSATTNSCVIKYNKIITLNVYDGMLQIQTDQKTYLFQVKDDFNFLLIIECIFDEIEKQKV